MGDVSCEGMAHIQHFHDITTASTAETPCWAGLNYDAELSSKEVRAADRAARGRRREGPASCSSAPYADWLGSLMPDPADHEWLLGSSFPEPLAATYTQPIRPQNPAAAAVPRTFVYCTEDKAAGEPVHQHRKPAPVGSGLALHRVAGQQNASQSRCELPWIGWSLHRLVTRMDSCRRTPCRGNRPRVAIAWRRRP